MILNYYQTCIHNCDRSTVDKTIKHNQLKNLKREMKEYQSYQRLDQ